MKKNPWYPATPTAMSHTRGRLSKVRASGPSPRHATNATIPNDPTARRTAATLGGQASGSNSALAVPEVLKSAAAPSTPPTPNRVRSRVTGHNLTSRVLPLR